MDLWHTLGVSPVGGVLIAVAGIATSVFVAAARLRKARSSSRLRLGLDDR